MPKYNEVRHDIDGKIDDIVIDGISGAHIERLDNNQWWISLYRGKKRTVFLLTAGVSGIDAIMGENDLGAKQA